MFISCEFDDSAATYNDKLVVFCNLPANLPLGVSGDTCFVSMSSAIDNQLGLNELYIDSATVTIINVNTGDVAEVLPVPGEKGKYLTADSIIFLPGETYELHVTYGDFAVSAETTIPGGMDFTSPENEMQICDGVDQVIPSVNTENFELQWLNYLSRPDTLLQLINFNAISDVVYHNGGCYTESFASFPLFLLDFEPVEFASIKVNTFALQAFERGLEPFDDLNGNTQFDTNSEPFTDFNRNGFRDSTFVNLIYDTTLIYRLWKENYFRDENGDPFRINPYTWQVSTPPVPMNWLFFNYYGLTLVILEATDAAYYNYYSGDPVGQNQYLLPDSNINGGYGLFSSTNSKAFLINVIPE